MKILKYFYAPRYSKNSDGHYVLPLSVRTSVLPYVRLYVPNLVNTTPPKPLPRNCSQYLSWYVVVHESWDTRLLIPTKSYGPLNFLLIYIIKGKHLVNTTSPKPLARNLQNLLTILALVCSCAWRLGFALAHSYQKLWPFEIFTDIHYIRKKSR